MDQSDIWRARERGLDSPEEFDLSQSKTCIRCGEVKSYTEFSKNVVNVTGHYSWCKQCRGECTGPCQRIGFYTESEGETIKDATYFTKHFGDVERIDAEYYAEKAAQEAWDNCDGWEYIDGAILVIVADDEEVGRFEIEVEHDPCFKARERKREDQDDK